MTKAIDKKLYACIEQLNPAQKKALLGFLKTILPPKKVETSGEQVKYPRQQRLK